MDARTPNEPTPKLRTILEVKCHPSDDLVAYYIVRTVWFAQNSDTMLEHETAPFKSFDAAQNWIDFA